MSIWPQRWEEAWTTRRGGGSGEEVDLLEHLIKVAHQDGAEVLRFEIGSGWDQQPLLHAFADISPIIFAPGATVRQRPPQPVK